MILKTVVQAIPIICFIIIGLIGVKVGFKFAEYELETKICIVLCIVAVVSILLSAWGVV
jgi:hypothetical protein